MNSGNRFSVIYKKVNNQIHTIFLFSVKLVTIPVILVKYCFFFQRNLQKTVTGTYCQKIIRLLA